MRIIAALSLLSLFCAVSSNAQNKSLSNGAQWQINQIERLLSALQDNGIQTIPGDDPCKDNDRSKTRKPKQQQVPETNVPETNNDRTTTTSSTQSQHIPDQTTTTTQEIPNVDPVVDPGKKKPCPAPKPCKSEHSERGQSIPEDEPRCKDSERPQTKD
jgi:hypothetical protein